MFLINNLPGYNKIQEWNVILPNLKVIFSVVYFVTVSAKETNGLMYVVNGLKYVAYVVYHKRQYN